MSLFRYPGGKSKLKNIILDKLNSFPNIQEYKEPFFGGGSIGLEFLKQSSILKYSFNDKDVGLYCLWSSIKDYPLSLKEKIMAFSPSIDLFFKFKDELLNLLEVPTTKTILINNALKKLAIHQISYSGLGTKSGGPLGGLKQKSKYKIDCRWSPENICKKIDIINSSFKEKNINLSSVDFSQIINNSSGNTLIYLDPPYFDKGNDLYQYGFSLEDHERLMNFLKKTRAKWVLSYDNVPEIRDLYNWANIEILDVNYTISTSRQKTELLIYV